MSSLAIVGLTVCLLGLVAALALALARAAAATDRQSLRLARRLRHRGARIRAGSLLRLTGAKR